MQDVSGAAVPGASVKVTQTETGLTRTVEAAADGAYSFVNLPVGPYKLEATKEGFATYAQSGIVLQVNSNPTINISLTIGSVSEQIEVQASAAMVETHSNAIGQVIDQARVVELPLNGRQATDLIFLSGAATAAPAGDLNSNKNYPTQTISVTGGLPTGMTYVLDGGSYNDPFNNLNLPVPFPDALQEFKVETSALPARYGQHASAAVNGVTKAGTNEIHGDGFWFLRNYMFNARNTFATARDNLKRNQLGGVVGGPIVTNKLFFFAGYQGTIRRSAQPSTLVFTPTQAMLDGDWTSFASVQCQNKVVTLPTSYGFSGNKIDPKLYDSAAKKMLQYVPISTDPCGSNRVAIPDSSTEHQILGRIDYQPNEKHTLYGRYFVADYSNPDPFDGKNLLTANKTAVANRAQSFVYGDTYLFSPTTINALHATINRTRNQRTLPTYFDPASLGINVYSPIQGFMGVSVTGGFSMGNGGNNPGYFNSTSIQIADDLDLVRGSHQFAVGVNWIGSRMKTLNNRPTNGGFTYNGSYTGLGYADFMLGMLGSFTQGNPVYDDDESQYFGMYIQDSWRLSQRLTVNYGVRWEPFFPQTNTKSYAMNFDVARFNSGAKSTVYPQAPAGFLFAGDSGFPGKSEVNRKLMDFTPRFGMVWDTKGDGRMTVRASWGMFYDSPQLFFFTRVANNPPWGAQVTLQNQGTTLNPWASYPGGNPFPAYATTWKTLAFPQFGTFVNIPLDLNPTNLQQWNIAVQKQVGDSLMVSATYLGNHAIHLWSGRELNPAVYIPGTCVAGQYGLTKAGNCSQTSNSSYRRQLYLQNQTNGQYIGTMGQADDGGTQTYHGILLAAQRRMANNFSVNANWTWSHCISDPETTEITGPTYLNPNNRSGDRANCSADRRNLVNVSLVANSPNFESKALRMLATGWQLSNIFRFQTGGFSTLTTGQDNALMGSTGLQRPVQIDANPYGDGTAANYLNRAAFVVPATGTLSTLAPLNIQNPGSYQFDIGVSRIFNIREGQKLHFRWETFNVLNMVNLNAPGTSMSTSSTFGKITTAADPRIMQFALKYVF